MAGRRRWRSREVILDSFDEAMFMLAMWETFPRMWVMHGRKDLFQASDLIGQSGLATLISQNAPLWNMHFPDEGWRPNIVTRPGGRFNFMTNAPRHFLHYLRGGWSWST